MDDIKEITRKARTLANAQEWQKIVDLYRNSLSEQTIFTPFVLFSSPNQVQYLKTDIIPFAYQIFVFMGLATFNLSKINQEKDCRIIYDLYLLINIFLVDKVSDYYERASCLNPILIPAWQGYNELINFQIKQNLANLNSYILNWKSKKRKVSFDSNTVTFPLNPNQLSIHQNLNLKLARIYTQRIKLEENQSKKANFLFKLCLSLEESQKVKLAYSICFQIINMINMNILSDPSLVQASKLKFCELTFKMIFHFLNPSESLIADEIENPIILIPEKENLNFLMTLPLPETPAANSNEFQLLLMFENLEKFSKQLIADLNFSKVSKTLLKLQNLQCLIFNSTFDKTIDLAKLIIGSEIFKIPCELPKYVVQRQSEEMFPSPSLPLSTLCVLSIRGNLSFNYKVSSSLPLSQLLPKQILNYYIFLFPWEPLSYLLYLQMSLDEWIGKTNSSINENLEKIILASETKFEALKNVNIDENLFIDKNLNQNIVKTKILQNSDLLIISYFLYSKLAYTQKNNFICLNYCKKTIFIIEYLHTLFNETLYPWYWNKCHIMLAKCLELNYSLSEAELAYLNVLKLKSDEFEAIEGLGNLYYCKRDFIRSLEFYEKIENLETQDQEEITIQLKVKARISWIYSLPHLKNTLTSSEDWKKDYTKLGQIKRMKIIQEKILVDQSWKSAISNLETHILKASGGKKDFEKDQKTFMILASKSRQKLREICNSLPDWPWCSYWLGRLDWIMHDKIQARDLWISASKLGFPHSLASLGTYYAFEFVKYGLYSDLEKSKNCYFVSMSRYLKYKTNYDSYILGEGEMNLNQNEKNLLEAALPLLQILLEESFDKELIDPTYSKLKIEEAQKFSYEKAMEILASLSKSGHPWAYFKSAVFEMRQGNFSSATISLQNYIRLHKDDCNAWLCLCEAYKQQGKWLAAYKIISSLKNNDPFVFYMKALILFKLNRLPEAIEAIKKSKSLSLKDEKNLKIPLVSIQHVSNLVLARYLLDYHKVSLNEGNLKQAISSLKEATKIALDLQKETNFTQQNISPSFKWKLLGDIFCQHYFMIEIVTMEDMKEVNPDFENIENDDQVIPIQISFDNYKDFIFCIKFKKQKANKNLIESSKSYQMAIKFEPQKWSHYVDLSFVLFSLSKLLFEDYLNRDNIFPKNWSSALYYIDESISNIKKAFSCFNANKNLKIQIQLWRQIAQISYYYYQIVEMTKEKIPSDLINIPTLNMIQNYFLKSLIVSGYRSDGSDQNTRPLNDVEIGEVSKTFSSLATFWFQTNSLPVTWKWAFEQSKRLDSSVMIPWEILNYEKSEQKKSFENSRFVIGSLVESIKNKDNESYQFSLLIVTLHCIRLLGGYSDEDEIVETLNEIKDKKSVHFKSWSLSGYGKFIEESAQNTISLGRFCVSHLEYLLSKTPLNVTFRHLLVILKTYLGYFSSESLIQNAKLVQLMFSDQKEKKLFKNFKFSFSDFSPSISSMVNAALIMEKSGRIKDAWKQWELIFPIISDLKNKPDIIFISALRILENRSLKTFEQKTLQTHIEDQHKKLLKNTPKFIENGLFHSEKEFVEIRNLFVSSFFCKLSLSSQNKNLPDSLVSSWPDEALVLLELWFDQKSKKYSNQDHISQIFQSFIILILSQMISSSILFDLNYPNNQRKELIYKLFEKAQIWIFNLSNPLLMANLNLIKSFIEFYLQNNELQALNTLKIATEFIEKVPDFIEFQSSSIFYKHLYQKMPISKIISLIYKLKIQIISQYENDFMLSLKYPNIKKWLESVEIESAEIELIKNNSIQILYNTPDELYMEMWINLKEASILENLQNKMKHNKTKFKNQLLQKWITENIADKEETNKIDLVKIVPEKDEVQIKNMHSIPSNEILNPKLFKAWRISQKSVFLYPWDTNAWFNLSSLTNIVLNTLKSNQNNTMMIKSACSLVSTLIYLKSCESKPKTKFFLNFANSQLSKSILRLDDSITNFEIKNLKNKDSDSATEDIFNKLYQIEQSRFNKLEIFKDFKFQINLILKFIQISNNNDKIIDKCYSAFIKTIVKLSEYLFSNNFIFAAQQALSKSIGYVSKVLNIESNLYKSSLYALQSACFYQTFLFVHTNQPHLALKFLERALKLQNHLPPYYPPPISILLKSIIYSQTKKPKSIEEAKKFISIKPNLKFWIKQMGLVEDE